MTALRSFAVCLALAAAVALPAAWRNWEYSRAVNLPPAAEARLASVAVPHGVQAGAGGGLAAVRVVDEQGREVPYVRLARTGQRTREWRSARLLEPSFRPGEYTEALVDTGAARQIHNSLELETDERDFFAWVELSVSDDARTWRILRDRAPIYRFTRDALPGNQVLTYPDTLSRYLRVRVLEGAQLFSLREARVAREVAEEAERVPVPLPLAADSSAPQQQNWWRAGTGSTPFEVSEVRFETPQPEFHRAVRVSQSEDGQTWETAGTGEIYRIGAGDKKRESLAVEFPGSSARYWRVEVLNRNDAPLAGLAPALFVTPWRVIFRQEPGRSYRLLYGNTRARAPEYDLRRLTDRKALEAAALGSLGAEELNSAYADPRPWSERHPQVLWLALGLAVVVLGTLALRALRHPA